jgi:hypothetical protein
MKKVKLFEDFLNEVTQRSVSGTSGRTYIVLDNSKYELKKDIKGARIGDYTNVTLPKGTIIYNLPGGVFAFHTELKTKYKSEKWHDKFGVMIRQLPETLEAIEDNSKVLESEAVYHENDFLGMQAQAANMSREEWIAHYGSPEIGSGIDESKKGIYMVFFDDKNGMDWDWEVEASSPEEAIKLVQDGKALGPYNQTLPRGARNFTAKLYK